MDGDADGDGVDKKYRRLSLTLPFEPVHGTKDELDDATKEYEFAEDEETYATPAAR